MSITYFLPDYKPRQEEPNPQETEPRVLTCDVARILRDMVRPDDDDSGSSVFLVAEKASTSTRTVYRVLAESTLTISLDLADRLCLAANSHLAACRLKHSTGAIVPYSDGENDAIMNL
jgi:hypothetical protein